MHDKRFPNESSDYRQARDQVLKLEIELRQKIAELGEARRKMPLGGRLKQDYAFAELDTKGSVHEVNFSQLFPAGIDTLFVYSFMYGPKMEKPCPACTSLIDTLNISCRHIEQRAACVVVAKSPIERVRAFGGTRGWNNVRLLSSANNTYNSDYFAENNKGEQIPAMNVFTRRKDGIFHFFNTELLYADLDGHPRHMDLAWPLWNLLDMTPEGRGEGWFPTVY